MILKKLLPLLLATASFIPFAKSAIVVGTGDDISYAVIQASAFGAPLIFEYHYTYDSGNPFDTYFLLESIEAEYSAISFEWDNFGDLVEPNYFLNTVTYNSFPLTNTGGPTFSPYWVQWVAGGESGYPVAVPIAINVWDLGSGMSAPYRLVQPGSWDGVIYNDGSVPPVSPVPEPSTWMLLVLGSVGVFYLKKCRAPRSL